MGRALFFNIMASFFNVILVVVIKLMVNEEIITPEIASFFRHISALIIILPFILLTLKTEPSHFVENAPQWVMILRAVCFTVGTFLWPIVFTHIPMHIAMTIGFLAPFVSNILLVVFLKEKIPKHAWIAKLFAVIGVVVILEPYIHDFNRYYILAVVCVMFWGIASTLNKFIAQRKVRINISLYYVTIYSVIFTGMIVYFGKIEFPNNVLKPILYLGLLSVASQYFSMKAYQVSKGYLVNAMEFVRFLMYLAMDIIVFGADIKILTMVGAVIIGVSVYSVVKRHEY